MVDFSDMAIAAYGRGQDLSSTVEIQDLGATLALTGSGWKRVEFAYDITKNTILEFEFKLGSLGEIHAIGFDNDRVPSANQAWQLSGTERWGLSDFSSHSPRVGEWRSYRISVGDYFTGSVGYLTLINDHGVSNPTAASLFRNVRVYEQELAATAKVQPQRPIINFSTATITSYGQQDKSSQLSYQDQGDSVLLSGNGWKKLALQYDVTKDTVLVFDFKSERQGEIHAIGFDDDDRNSSNRAFQLYGTQDWGRQEFRNYAVPGAVPGAGAAGVTGAGQWQRYEIPVGQFFTGAMNYLTLINDHDVKPRDARSFFRNVQVFERGGGSEEVPFDLGNLQGVSSRRDSLSAMDQGDRYRFSLDQTRDFSVILEGLGGNANLALFDSSGQLVLSATQDGNQTEQLSYTLAAGNYELAVTAASLDVATDYDLIFSATPDGLGQNRQLEVSTATYLGGIGQDEASAIEISVRNELVVAGNFSAAQGPGQAFLGANTSSAGQILRLSLSGREVLSVTHLGNDINDMDVNRQTGAIAAGGDFGITVLSPTADRIYWSQNLGAPVERVAIANDGTVVTLHNKTISVWNPGGSLRSQTSLVRSYVNDLAIDPTSGKLYVTGFDNKYNSLDRNPVQVAFLTGFDLDLNVNWQTWGQDANSLTLPVTTPQGDRPQNDMADTRGYRITVGRDGGLYFLGEVAGGNSIFRWNGKDRTTATQVKYDAYNDPYNSASPHQAYYARINAQTGEVMQGQLAFPRYNGAANAFRVDQGTIAADEQGNIYVGGVTFSGGGWPG